MARDTCVAEGKPRKQAERGQSSASQEKMLQIKTNPAVTLILTSASRIVQKINL